MGDALVGASPDLTRYHMELRGLGVINIKDLYGVSSIRLSKRVELVVNLERWEAGKEYDRLGLRDERFLILGVEVPLMRMPVAPGRNIGDPGRGGRAQPAPQGARLRRGPALRGARGRDDRGRGTGEEPRGGRRREGSARALATPAAVSAKRTAPGGAPARAGARSAPPRARPSRQAGAQDPRDHRPLGLRARPTSRGPSRTSAGSASTTCPRALIPSVRRARLRRSPRAAAARPSWSTCASAGFLSQFPAVYQQAARPRAWRRASSSWRPTRSALLRRFSETRRPHPLAVNQPVIEGIREERRRCGRSARWPTSSSTPRATPCTSCATTSASTTTCASEAGRLVVSVMSFGYKYGVPLRGRPRLRRALPAQPELRPALEAPDRATTPRWCATCGAQPETTAFLGELECLPGLRAAALRAGGEELPHDRGRAAPAAATAR